MSGRRLHLVGTAAGASSSPPAARPLLREVVGARLRRARAAQERSLRDVAEAAGVSVGHLSQVERGLAEASYEVLRAVCRALGLPMSALLRAASADLAAADLAVVVDLTATPAAEAVARTSRQPLGASSQGGAVTALAA